MASLTPLVIRLFHSVAVSLLQRWPRPTTTVPLSLLSSDQWGYGVPVNTSVVLTFNETIDPTSINDNTISIGVQQTGSAGSGTITVNGAIVTFTPAAPLPANTRIFVQAFSVADLIGNNSNSFFSTFDTGAVADVTAPEVQMVTPTDGATDIGPNAVVVLTFSESLNANTINSNNFGLFAGSNRLFVSVSRSADNRTVTLATTLPFATVFSVVVTADVQDLSGNHLADFTSQFTTGAQPDTDRPSVVSQRPGNGASGVVLDRSVVLYVDMPLQPATVTEALHISQNGVLVNGTVNVSGSGKVIEFVPTASWQNNALVQVFLDNNAKDLGGNALNNYQGSFRTALDPSTTTPQVVRVSPSNNNAVVLNPVIELEYNEPLDPTTINSTTVTLRETAGAQPSVLSTVSLVRAGRVIRLVPNAPLAPNTGYFYQVSPNIRDLDGMSPGFFSTVFFNTTTETDNTSPQVLAVSPFDGATDVGINAQIRVRFDEPINPLSITGATVLVSAGSNVAMPSTISLSNNDREVLIVPHSPLPDATLMSIKVEGVEDLAGNPVVVHTIQFTTGAAPDVMSPQIVRTNPFPGASEVPVNSVITLESSEALDPVTINSNTLIVRDNVTFTNLAGTIALSMNGRTLTFVPNTPLAVGRNHSVFFAFQGIQDLAGNFLSGSNLFFTTSFAADVIGPQVTGLSPVAGLTQVPINAQVVVTFNEPIQSQSVDGVTLAAGATPIAVTHTLSNGNRTLTLTPTVLLPANTLFTVNITGVKDLAGNNLLTPLTSSFSTGTGADLIRPTITQIDPASGATGVPTNALIRLQFSERINPLSVTSSNFQVIPSGGATINGTITIAADGLSASFAPTGGLAISTSYFVQVFSITDLTGQEISFFFASFTTGLNNDFTTPTVLSANPPDGSTNVPVNARVVVKLSEPVSVVSLGSGSITLSQGGNSQAGVTTISGDRTTLTFTSSNPLATNTAYVLNVAGFTDVAGNQIVPFSSSFMTSASSAADVNSPFITFEHSSQRSH